MERDVLVEYLSYRVMVITFTKKDGTDRTMLCTKSLALIPKEKHPHSLTTKLPAPHLITVFDLDIKEWRSFRYDAVTEVSLGTPSGIGV